MESIQEFRLTRVWVTDYGSCLRKTQYKFQGLEELPKHFLQVSGRIVHEVIEQVLRGEEVEPDFSEMPEAEAEIRRKMEEPLRNLSRWVEETKLDIGGASQEEKLEMDVGDGYVLVGKPDLLAPSLIVDFKSGERRNTRENRVQLVAYKVLGEHGGVCREPKLVNVFLGGEKWVEYELKPKEVEEASVELMDWLEKRKGVLELIKKNVQVPCEVSFSCLFCGFRHICRGV